jgi:hypothetical protein
MRHERVDDTVKVAITPGFVNYQFSSLGVGQWVADWWPSNNGDLDRHFECDPRVVVPRSELFVDARGIRSARRLSQERFEHVLVDVGRRADFDVPYVLAIAFEKASWVL